MFRTCIQARLFLSMSRVLSRHFMCSRLEAHKTFKGSWLGISFLSVRSLSLSLPLCLLITYCNLNEKEKMNRHDKRILTAASTAVARLFSLLLNYDVTEMNRSQSHYANLIAVIE